MKLLKSTLWLATLAAAIDDQVPIELQQPTPEEPTTKPLILDAIPLLGFGTWNLKENCTEAVSHAIQVGYRHIDAAAIYGNENYVGLGIADGIRRAGIKREDLCKLFLKATQWRVTDDRCKRDHVEALVSKRWVKGLHGCLSQVETIFMLSSEESLILPYYCPCEIER